MRHTRKSRWTIVLGVSVWFLGAGVVHGADVKSFGAAGDGRADDTVAIQRAVDAGGQVTFPEGTYRLTGTVTVSLDRAGFTSLSSGGAAKIVMAAPGPAFHIVGTNTPRDTLANLSPGIMQRQRMPLVDGLAIQGEHPEANGIEVSGAVQFTVTRTHIRGVRHGIHLTQSNRNVIISNCHIYANSGIGIFYDDLYLHQSNIIGCHISYNMGGGVVSRAGDVRNIQIGTCDIEGNMGPDAPPTANVLIDAR
ncbi:MAG: glycosyl hydrolase family 28-related protein, partial [Planctomycetota bacterium]